MDCGSTLVWFVYDGWEKRARGCGRVEFIGNNGGRDGCDLSLLYFLLSHHLTANQQPPTLVVGAPGVVTMRWCVEATLDAVKGFYRMAVCICGSGGGDEWGQLKFGGSNGGGAAGASLQ
ncbi:Serine/threonine-protein kinase [Actinidia chinensis var. chinensis]|uniref:Serine/threonine-protein kinase n=1 Tax=Actinidia chinensis var. chinensis TaxID=1590841 RepID=A0A2R6QGX7_ACTCC|nr:Serine/threonine-protein kinase [Actinidia chinensis var. chinensis]